MAVVITGTFLNAVTGLPHTGRGYIEPSTPVLQDTGSGSVTLAGQPFDLDANGSFSVSVLATDDPSLTPQGFTYRLGIRLTDDAPYNLDDLYFLAPQALGTVDVSDLIDVGPPVPPSAPLEPSEYAELDARLDTLEAATDMVTFSFPGELSVTTGTSRLYNDSGSTRTLTNARASVGTAPVGAAVVVDVKKNGTTTYGVTTPPTISAGTNTGASAPDSTSWAHGDYLTVDVTDVGSSVTGSDLTVTISYR